MVARFWLETILLSLNSLLSLYSVLSRTHLTARGFPCVKGTGIPPWVIQQLTVIQSRSLCLRSFIDLSFRVATELVSRVRRSPYSRRDSPLRHWRQR
jgi:hypothetical protein